MTFGVPGLKRVWVVAVFALLTIVSLVACGYSSAPRQPTGSGLKFRAFVSNPLAVFGNGTFPVLQVVDAAEDVLGNGAVNLSGVQTQPGLMVLSPNKQTTLVFSAANNSVAVVSNPLESIAVGAAGSALPAITLPDFTESMVIALDNVTAYAAVRNAPVTGQQPGIVEVLNLPNAAITHRVDVPSVHYIVQSHNGNRILAFSDNQDAVTVISPSLIGTNDDPRTVVCPDGTPHPDLASCDPNAPKILDRPVWGIFSSDDTTAYILNCGAECGGTAAGIVILDLNTNSASVRIPLDAATMGLLDGSTLYVAGTPPNTACGSGTAATSCGTLQTVDLSSMTASASVLITDGYHNRMEMGANGQLFIGAHTCTNINLAGGEVRGCLSVFNTATAEVVIPPDNGDVTGIQPITNRNVVYVTEGGELRIYDTTTDALQATQINIIGQAIDVKLVDF
jgi:hypothetical protein